MWGVLPGDFSQAASGQTIDHGVRPHFEEGNRGPQQKRIASPEKNRCYTPRFFETRNAKLEGIFPVASGDGAQEGEGRTASAENPGSSSNGEIVVSENHGLENMVDESERGWIPAYPGEYG